MDVGTDLFSAYSSTEISIWRQRMRRHLREQPIDECVALVAWRTGPPVFPPICPNCMSPAAGEFKVERCFTLKVEDSDGDDQTKRSVEEFTFPVCAPCLQRHRAEQRPAGLWQLASRVLGFSGSGGLGLGGLAVFVIGLLFLNSGLQRFDTVALLLSAVPMLIGLCLMFASWKANGHVTIPNETSVSMAVEITPSLELAEEPHWRAYRFRLPKYAALFRQANQSQLWDPQGQEAQSARVKRKEKRQRLHWVYITLGVIVVLYWVWSDYIEPFFNR